MNTVFSGRALTLRRADNVIAHGVRRTCLMYYWSMKTPCFSEHVGNVYIGEVQSPNGHLLTAGVHPSALLAETCGLVGTSAARDVRYDVCCRSFWSVRMFWGGPWSCVTAGACWLWNGGTEEGTFSTAVLVCFIKIRLQSLLLKATGLCL